METATPTYIYLFSTEKKFGMVNPVLRETSLGEDGSFKAGFFYTNLDHDSREMNLYSKSLRCMVGIEKRIFRNQNPIF